MCFAPTQIPGSDWVNEDVVWRKREKRKENNTLSNKQHTWVDNLTFNFS